MGGEQRALILDAFYRRGGLAFGPTNFLVPGLSNKPVVKNSNGNIYLYGSSPSSYKSSEILTDEILNSLWASVMDPNSSRYNCDCYMNYASKGFPAVEYTRSILVNGIGCDVPNTNILMRMACDCDFIDSMDQTVALYPERALGGKNPNRHWYISDSAGDGGGNSWSSTQVDKDRVVYLDELSDFYLGPWSKSTQQSQVMPVFEL